MTESASPTIWARNEDGEFIVRPTAFRGGRGSRRNTMLYDRARINARAGALRAQFPPAVQLHYAVKATDGGRGLPNGWIGEWP